MRAIQTSLVAAALALSGAAFAATAQPAAGEAPYVDTAAVLPSTLTRSEVQAQAVAHRPLSGMMNASIAQTPSTLTRAEVRQATVNAIANGFHVQSGEQS
ncbi:MAG: hypothetical protein LC137_09815 [Burkholderiales bacterium]|nr:hypothetical protein [Burkholderiales bacterium]